MKVLPSPFTETKPQPSESSLSTAFPACWHKLNGGTSKPGSTSGYAHSISSSKTSTTTLESLLTASFPPTSSGAARNTGSRCAASPHPHGAWVAICGTDLVRTNDGYAVLEDNLRVPSGVSYMIATRKVVKANLRNAYRGSKVLDVEHYGRLLHQTIIELAHHRE